MDVVLDASVFAKWFLPDETDPISARIKKDFREGKIAIFAPDVLFYEFMNILKIAIKSKRLTQVKALKSLDRFISFEINFRSSDGFYLDAYNVSVSKDTSIYDASYVALSQKLEIPLYTADKKLIKAVKSKFVLDYMDYELD